MKKFWNWVKNEEGRTLYFDGYIAQDSWFDDDVTPKKFKDELMASPIKKGCRLFRRK